jgi:hypothetical protein
MVAKWPRAMEGVGFTEDGLVNAFGAQAAQRLARLGETCTELFRRSAEELPFAHAARRVTLEPR